jgi:rRNA maturation endonuclease Nob1
VAVVHKFTKGRMYHQCGACDSFYPNPKEKQDQCPVCGTKFEPKFVLKVVEVDHLNRTVTLCVT